MGTERQILVFGVKQQVGGRTATIMNPIEGELDSGGQLFSGGQKAISQCPSVYECVSVVPHTLLQRRVWDKSENKIVYGVENCFQGEQECCICRLTGIIALADFYWKIPPEFVVVRIKSQCQA